MSTIPYDLLIIGAGHNGLTTAHSLSQAERPALAGLTVCSGSP